MLGGRQMQAQTTLGEALNVPGGTLEFTSSSTYGPPYPWTVVTGPGATHDGASAARSGATGYFYSSGTYIRSMLNTTLAEPGVLTFWVKKAGSGTLKFYVNGAYSQTIEDSWETNGEWRFHQVKLRLFKQATVQWCFENLQSGSQPGQAVHYFLLDEVRWHPADEQGCVFQLNEDGNSYAVWTYLGQAAEVNIPATFEGKPVTVIAANAFVYNENNLSVILPEGLLRIEDHAFSSRYLSSVTLPSTLQHIGASAFYNCQNLKQVTLPANLTELGEMAFCGAGLEQVVLPPGLSNIPMAAFQSCRSLRSLVIPATVQEIGNDAFSNCDLTSIVFADRGGNDITLGERCFAFNLNLRECILPEGITTLPPYMLAGNESGDIDLPAIRIPASVTSLDSLAFDFCHNVVIFFMGPPPLVVEPIGRSGGGGQPWQRPGRLSGRTPGGLDGSSGRRRQVPRLSDRIPRWRAAPVARNYHSDRKAYVPRQRRGDVHAE